MPNSRDETGYMRRQFFYMLLYHAINIANFLLLDIVAVLTVDKSIFKVYEKNGQNAVNNNFHN